MAVKHKKHQKLKTQSSNQTTNAKTQPIQLNIPSL